MPTSAVQFLRPKVPTIFAQDPAALGVITAFLLTNVVTGINTPGRISLDLMRQARYAHRYAWTENPVARPTTDNAIEQPVELTITGQISATPLILFGALGVAGAFVRRDLRAVAMLRSLAKRRQPVFVSMPDGPYPNMGITSIDERHDGRNAVELTISFRKVRVVGALAAISLQAEALATGAAASNSGGVASTPSIVDPDVGGLG